MGFFPDLDENDDERAEHEEEVAALRATVARLEAERDDERRQRLLYEADIREYVSDIDRLISARDAAGAALVEETARRLWCEWYLRELEGDILDELRHWHSDTSDGEREGWRRNAREALAGDRADEGDDPFIQTRR